jgi:nucleoside 2-deoxyribosyltransferase
MTRNPVVVGGIYNETCLFPYRHTVLGSGGRAACALAQLGQTVDLFSPMDSETRDTFAPIADSFRRIQLYPWLAPEAAAFFYAHPLAIPAVRPTTPLPSTALQVPAANKMLYFGMLEGLARVVAETVVYDPQSDQPHWFTSLGTARRLAYVLNAAEATALTGERDPGRAALAILEHEGAEIVLIKLGPWGSLVCADGLLERLPCYRTPNLYKIGSGDIFATTFFLEWAINERAALDSAHSAARATALYCGWGGEPQVLDRARYEDTSRWNRAAPKTDQSVYLAGPFFATATRWLVAESFRVLTDFGLDVFSPFHHVGMGTSAAVARKDLEALSRCSLVYALVDGVDAGTLFEVGYARALKIPLVALAETESDSSLTMLVGSGCRVLSDFAASLYECCWEQ